METTTTTNQQAPSWPRSWVYGIPTFLVAITTLVYYKTLWYDFIFDDLPTITNYFHNRVLDIQGQFFSNPRWISRVLKPTHLPLLGQRTIRLPHRQLYLLYRDRPSHLLNPHACFYPPTKKQFCTRSRPFNYLYYHHALSPTSSTNTNSNLHHPNASRRIGCSLYYGNH